MISEDMKRVSRMSMETIWGERPNLSLDEMAECWKEAVELASSMVNTTDFVESNKLQVRETVIIPVLLSALRSYPVSRGLSTKILRVTFLWDKQTDKWVVREK